MLNHSHNIMAIIYKKGANYTEEDLKNYTEEAEFVNQKWIN